MTEKIEETLIEIASDKIEDKDFNKKELDLEKEIAKLDSNLRKLHRTAGIGNTIALADLTPAEQKEAYD